MSLEPNYLYLPRYIQIKTESLKTRMEKLVIFHYKSGSISHDIPPILAHPPRPWKHPVSNISTYARYDFRSFDGLTDVQLI